MNDDELQQQLRKLAVPPASDAAQARARYRAMVAFQQRGSPNRRPLVIGTGWHWRSGVVLAIVVGFLPLFPMLFFKHISPAESLANDRQLLHQTEQLFPDQVNAVVERNGKVDLSIAQDPVLGAGQPVLLLFKRGRDTIRVLSYSGHRVCLNLGASNPYCFDILATPTGGVILEGEKQVWMTADRPKIAGYSVRGQMLGASL